MHMCYIEEREIQRDIYRNMYIFDPHALYIYIERDTDTYG